jgi:hypothetical protein
VERPPPRRTAAVLASLVLANLLLNAAAACLLRSDDIQRAIFLVAMFLIAIGLQVGQTILLAFWISLSEERWYWRLAVPALLSMGLVTTGTFSAGLGLAESGLVALVVQVLLWILVALLLPLRRLRGWRLRRGRSAQPALQGRYGTRDLLLWMMVIAVPLAIGRLLLPPGTQATVTAGLRVIGLLGLLLIPLLWLEMLAALAPRGRRHSWRFAGGILAYVAVATAVGAREFYSLVFDAFWWPRAGWILVLLSIAIAGSFFVLPSLNLWLNCLALRHAGWQLDRPAQIPA